MGDVNNPDEDERARREAEAMYGNSRLEQIVTADEGGRKNARTSRPEFAPRAPAAIEDRDEIAGWHSNVFQPDDHIATDVDIAGGQTHRLRLTQQEHPETSRIALGRGDVRHLQYTAPVATGRLPSTNTQNRPLPSSRNVDQVPNQRVFSNDARAHGTGPFQTAVAAGGQVPLDPAYIPDEHTRRGYGKTRSRKSDRAAHQGPPSTFRGEVPGHGSRIGGNAGRGRNHNVGGRRPIQQNNTEPHKQPSSTRARNRTAVVDPRWAPERLEVNRDVGSLTPEAKIREYLAAREPSLSATAPTAPTEARPSIESVAQAPPPDITPAADETPTAPLIVIEEDRSRQGSRGPVSIDFSSNGSTASSDTSAPEMETHEDPYIAGLVDSYARFSIKDQPSVSNIPSVKSMNATIVANGNDNVALAIGDSSNLIESDDEDEVATGGAANPVGNDDASATDILVPDSIAMSDYMVGTSDLHRQILSSEEEFWKNKPVPKV
ncbi:hypothetical protein LTR64_006935 [Lithohypha guttulata]|uniref:uncharacterized protein n=1 Tax=Lithohypha guttulata TaxID=1690604 RepID=UPI002DE0565D|nr:hypothetical protein LTR51_004508 [Lithohypha guttulata]